MKIKFKVQSIIDVITNSSTEVFTTVNSTTISNVYALLESLYDKNARELFKVSIDYNSANNKLRYIEEASNEDEVWDAMQKLGYNTYNISFDTFIELINNLNDNVLDKKIISYEEFCADIEGESTIVIEVLSDDKKHIEIAKKITDLLKSVNADYTTDY